MLINLSFHAVHLIVILWNCFAWLNPAWRFYHLMGILLTWFSWIILGYFYGFGYCFLTDWHWQYLRSQGENGLPASYITYILRLMSLEISPFIVDIITVSAFISASVISIYLNADLFRKR